jgi:hypothetical protein
MEVKRRDRLLFENLGWRDGSAQPGHDRPPRGRLGAWRRRLAYRGVPVAYRAHRCPDDLPRRRAWLDETVSVLDQGVPGAYVNFVDDEGEERVRAAYPGVTWDRLVAVKSRYDPDNVFRLNQNIPPSPA